MNMKKSIISNVMLIILIIFFYMNNVYATDDVYIKELEDKDAVTREEIERMDKQVFDKEEKILKYDAITKTTTEVDTEELLKLLAPEKVGLQETKGANRISAFTNMQRYNHKNFLQASSNPEITRFTMIGNTLAVPYRYVGCIMIGTNGTGYLVGPNLLLTAAHCVVDSNPDSLNYGNNFPSWNFYPAYNNGTYNNLRSTWTSVYYSSNYNPTDNSKERYQYDWCLCVLSDDLGSKMGGWIGCQRLVYDSSFTDGLKVEEYGYPRIVENSTHTDYIHYAMYTEGKTYSPTTNTFSTTAVSTVGLSGGPVYALTYDKSIGIVVGYIKNENNNTLAVRINKEIINLINALQ